MNKLHLITALALAALAGCGGNVVVDNPNGGSGGNGGGGAGGTSSTSSSTTTTNSQTLCQSVCATAAQYGCLGGTSLAECTQGCEDVFTQYPMCSAQIAAIYQCAADSITQQGCNNNGDICQKESQAFSECAQGGTGTCGTDTCGGSGGGNGGDCFCTGECNNEKLEADCKGSPNSVECVCLVNGSQVGTCTDVNLSCDLFNGCCAAFFPL